MKHYSSILTNDKVLKPFVVKDLKLSITSKPLWLSLMGSIMSQQLNTKVAAILYDRFMALFDQRKPTLNQVLAFDTDQLRGIGLSASKANYIHHIAAFFLEHKLTNKKIIALEDQAIMDLLTQIKGVGRWTVEMLLMFGLGREDVFAQDDYGIQKAMATLYDLDFNDKKQLKAAMQLLSEPWRPFRTYACLCLWQFKDMR